MGQATAASSVSEEDRVDPTRTAEDGSAVVLTYDGEVNVIDEETGETVLEKDLEFAPVEMAVVTGQPESVKPEEAADAESSHDDHDH